MEKITLFSEAPKSIGEFHLTSKEYCQYLYLPVKMVKSRDLVIEPRLDFLYYMVLSAMSDFSWGSGKSVFDNYVYLTVKQTFIAKETHHNRPGWHSDGFMTDDVQYIWFDKFPTEFLLGEYHVSKDDKLSMQEFDKFADNAHCNEYYHVFHQPEPYQLYRIDQNHIHRTTPATSDGVRTFIKITFSEHVYAQEGNSKNYLINYDWNLAPRYIDRNQPHAK